MDAVVNRRTVDSSVLTHVAVGYLACDIAARLLKYVRFLIDEPMDMSIKQSYAVHILRSKVRLDVPTSQDSAVLRQMEFASPIGSNKHVAWKTVLVLTDTLKMIISTISQFSVMFTVLREQQDGPLLIIVGISQSVIFAYTRSNLSRFLGR